MRIKVEVRNEILGDSVFWEGPAGNVQAIRNIPARETAKLVAQDGRSRVSGMWHVSALTDAGEPMSGPPATNPAERLVTFLKANASNIRPLRWAGLLYGRFSRTVSRERSGSADSGSPSSRRQA